MVHDVIRRIEFRPYLDGMGPTFRLIMWDTHRTRSGKSVLGYRLQQIDVSGKRTTLFKGEDFGCSPCLSIDGRESVAGLMTFLTLRPGDTDPEYFADYTPQQLAYCSEHADALGAHARYRFGEG